MCDNEFLLRPGSVNGFKKLSLEDIRSSAINYGRGMGRIVEGFFSPPLYQNCFAWNDVSDNIK